MDFSQVTADKTDLTAVFNQMWDELRGKNLYSGQPRGDATEQGLELARRAMEIANADGSDRLLAEASCMMAYALNANESYPEALFHYRQAIERLERGGDRHRAGRIRLGFLAALSVSGHCSEAMDVGREARKILLSYQDQVGLARLAANLGTVCQRLDDHQRALDQFIEAGELFERLGEKAGLAQVNLNAGNSLSFLDRFDEAATCYTRCEEIAYGAGLMDLWTQARYNKAYIFVLTGRYSEALGAYVELRSLFARRESRRHEALCDLDQCQIYLHLHLPPDAALLAERAVAAFEKLEMRYEQAKATAFLGVALAQARQFGEAQVAFRRAQELFDAQTNEIWVAILQLYRAEVLFSVGRLVEAKSLAAAAAETFKRLACWEKQIVSIVLLGRIALDAGRFDEAEQYAGEVRRLAETNPIPLFEFACHALSGQIAEVRSDYSAAREHYEFAAREFEKRHTHLHHDELGITFFKGKQEIYEALVEFSLNSDDHDGDATAFAWCEKAKSRTFVDMLAHHLRIVRSQADLALLDRVHRIRDELNGSYLRFRPEMRASTADGRAADIELKEAELIRALEDLSKVDAEYVSLQEVAVPKLEDLQQALQPDTAIVEYFVAGGEVLVFLITRTDFRIIRHVTPIERIHYLGGRIRVQTHRSNDASSGGTADTQSQNALHRLLRDLHRELVAPFINTVEANRLIIIPHGLMHLLPFRAFFDGEQYLGDRFDLCMAPSAAVFQSLMRRGPLALETENQHSSVSIETRAGLSEEALSADVIRINAPITLRQDNPLLSSLEFADGVLCAPDVYSLKYKAAVLALTGRQQRAGSVVTSDDVLGLVRGFLHAGANSVLTRLWDTPAEVTEVFMEAFALSWSENKHRGNAMKRATAIVREKFGRADYWGPFTIWGA